MLLGYDICGNIKFIFTDNDYLEKMYPNNTAKISDFWNIENHGLKELFVEKIDMSEGINVYHIVNSKLEKK